MRETRVRHAIKVNQDNEKDFAKLYEDANEEDCLL